MARERGVGQRLLTPDVWPVLPPLLGMLTGLVILLAVGWRPGLLVVGSAVGLAGVLRLVLPERVAGLLVVRSRVFDVIVLALLSAGIVVVALAR